MKPTISEIDKERLDWSLSWHPDGHCESFTREAILRVAPKISGVYGLFNRDCQVFIGQSENICEALLRHECETDFRSEHLRPTGFTFEPCAAESRKAKAADLIARFHPVLQTEASLSQLSAPSPSANENTAPTEAATTSRQKTNADQEFPEDGFQGRSKARGDFDAKRAIRIATLLLACVGIAAYLGISGNYMFHEQADGANTISDSRPQSASQSGVVKSTGTSPAKLAVHIPASAADSSTRLASKNIPAANPSTVHVKTNPTGPAAENPKPNKTWSVQVSATPSKEIANKLADQLKSEGYAVYVIQADVKGQIYHRVRIGPFKAREEAEPVRQSLTRREKFRNAYLAAD